MSNNGNGQLKAYPYQRRNIRLVEDEFNGRALIGDEMGLGKSLQAILFVKRKKLGETLPLLVICPKVVRHQWVKLIETELHITPDILETRKPARHQMGGQVAVINYDIIAWWRDWLEDQKYQTLILDECQYCIHLTAKRCKTAVALAKQIPYFLPLSGTPLENRPIELFPIINAMNPKAWPNKDAYAHRFCNPKWTRWGWNYKGASNIDELHARLKQTGLIRNLQKDVLSELPPFIRTIVPVELSDYSEYEKARDDFLGWLLERYPERLNKAVKAAALVHAGHLLRLAARLKLKDCVNQINHRLEQSDTEKILVFAVHKKCISVLKRRIKATSVIIDGSVPQHKRQIALKQFRDDPKTRVFIGNIKAAGIGLNMTEANTLFVVEMTQKPGPLLQIEKRIHRIGQTRRCWGYYFIATGTIEESISRLNQRKQGVITGVLDGGEVEDEFDLYDQLLLELEKERIR